MVLAGNKDKHFSSVDITSKTIYQHHLHHHHHHHHHCLHHLQFVFLQPLNLVPKESAYFPQTKTINLKKRRKIVTSGVRENVFLTQLKFKIYESSTKNFFFLEWFLKPSLWEYLETQKLKDAAVNAAFKQFYYRCQQGIASNKLDMKLSR